MNENMILALFEELKTSINGIQTKLQSISTSSTSSKNMDEYDPQFERVYDDIKALDGNLYFLIKEKAQEIIKDGQLDNEKKLERLEDYFSKHLSTMKVKHSHYLNVESSKVPLVLLGLGISLMFSLVGVFHLYQKNVELENNDWKYRYIKSTKGINRQELSVLENIFHYNPDSNKISMLKEQVLKYEQALEQKAQNLEKFELSE